MRVATVLLAALLAGTACTSVDFRPSGGAAHARYEGRVEVLRVLPPTGTYQMIGIVTVRGGPLTGDETMFERLEERAAAQGADAVVLQGPIRDRPSVDGGDERALAAYAIRRRP